MTQEETDLLARLVVEARQDLQRRRALVGQDQFELAVALYTPKDFIGALAQNEAQPLVSFLTHSGDRLGDASGQITLGGPTPLSSPFFVHLELGNIYLKRAAREEALGAYQERPAGRVPGSRVSRPRHLVDRSPRFRRSGRATHD